MYRPSSVGAFSAAETLSAAGELPPEEHAVVIIAAAITAAIHFLLFFLILSPPFHVSYSGFYRYKLQSLLNKEKEKRPKPVGAFSSESKTKSGLFFNSRIPEIQSAEFIESLNVSSVYIVRNIMSGIDKRQILP